MRGEAAGAGSGHQHPRAGQAAGSGIHLLLGVSDQPHPHPTLKRRAAIVLAVGVEAVEQLTGLGAPDGDMGFGTVGAHGNFLHTKIARRNIDAAQEARIIGQETLLQSQLPGVEEAT